MAEQHERTCGQYERLAARQRESELPVETAQATRQARNRTLADLKRELRDVPADHAIGAPLSDMAPGMSYADRQDQIMIMTADPDEAAWLLARLTE